VAGVRWLAFAILGLGACAPQREVAPVNPEGSDLAVYRSVLDSMFVPHRVGAIQQVVVFDSTRLISEHELRFLYSQFTQLPGVDSATVRNLFDRSHDARSLTPLSHLDLAVPVGLIDRKTLAQFPQNNPDFFWSQFYRLYPRSAGFAVFSGVGYNATRDVAILTTDFSCATLCGNGSLIVIKRVGGAWKIATIHHTWVS